MKVIKTKIQTCDACPSQWEETLEDGRMFYIRYRWGYLSVRVSEKPTEYLTDAVRGEEVYGKQMGDGLDGSLSWDEIPQEALDKL